MSLQLRVFVEYDNITNMVSERVIYFMKCVIYLLVSVVDSRM